MVAATATFVAALLAFRAPSTALAPRRQFARTHAPQCIGRAPPLAVDDSSEGAFQSSAWPVRTMVFIDGSWLYYSFHGRRPNCPVTAQYGTGWEYAYSIDFDRLPQLISQYVHAELLRRFKSKRFVEIVRTVVFTSARADTHKASNRMRMFRQMEDANFEVHMSVTQGYHEKCIDISLGRINAVRTHCRRARAAPRTGLRASLRRLFDNPHTPANARAIMLHVRPYMSACGHV